jgi:UDP-N-acetylglucosamine 2-epimerase (non-hydrolysing)
MKEATLRTLTIIGTRPEAIKLAPVIKEMHRFSDRIENIICSTGQHRSMLDQVFKLFDIQPDIELEIMEPDQSPAGVAARVLERLDPLLASLQPDWVLVQGDTTTVMAAAIAAHYRQVRAAHVEAGLRTYDRMNPFPEEMNRVVADHVCDLHFAPTKTAKSNLLREGIGPESIFVTGNTVIDAFLDVLGQPCPPEIRDLVEQPDRKLILVTAHRRENHGQPLMDICRALTALAARPDVHIVYTVHRNPNVWQPVHAQLAHLPNVTLLPPIDYLPMAHLMKRSYLILTDSGGVQEEAPALGIPVLVLRQVTERPEGVEAGVVRLVGTQSDRIVTEAARLLDDETEHQQMAQAVSPFGDGRAAERIVGLLLNGQKMPAGMSEWQ